MARFNVFLASMPKAGMHLMCNVLGSALDRQALSVHSPAQLMPAVNKLVATGFWSFLLCGHLRVENAGLIEHPDRWKFVVLIRDPRDVALSLIDLFETSSVPTHQQAHAELSGLCPTGKIRALLKGTTGSAPIRMHCSGWLEWEERGALLVRFEEITSPETAVRLARFLDVPVGRVRAAVAAHHGQPSRTFNKGVAGRWRDLPSEALAYFREHDGGVTERLGYSWGG